jgi:hypothetical protein
VEWPVNGPVEYSGGGAARPGGGGRPAPALPGAPDAVLTRAEVAAWLKVRPRQVTRLGIPCLRLVRKTVRYLAQDVQAWLEARRAGPLAGAPVAPRGG